MTPRCPENCDEITILQARDGKRLAKTIASDGKFTNYDDCFEYRGHTRTLAGLPDLMALLRILLTQPDCCVVRGELIEPASNKRIRRLAYLDNKNGDKPTLCEQPRRWLALDADNINRPEHVPAEDLLACADVVIDHLPLPFQQATCIVQASAGHGIKPGSRLRLWYWCDRPISGLELKRWLKGAPFDATVFRTVQPIYTAAPIFLEGGNDHLPYRLIEWPGHDWLRCPSIEELAPPPPRPTPPLEKIATGASADAYARGALIRAANAILAAGVGSRHDTIISEARGLARLVKAGLLRERDLSAVIARAAEHAGKTDGEEVGSMIAWALANPSKATLPEVRHAA